MHYGIVQFIELRGGNEGLQDGAVTHFGEGHYVWQAAVGVPSQQDGLGHRVALGAEAAAAPAFPFRLSRREKVLHVPEHERETPVPGREHKDERQYQNSHGPIKPE